MADKPLYYGSMKGTPMYYGGGNSQLYGGSGKKGPMYYSGSGNSYGAYGSYGQYGASGGQNDEGSMIGVITPGRMLRVISQRWLSIFVFLLIGLIASFAVYRVSPTIYQASSEFTMDIRHAGGRNTSAIDQAMPNLGDSYGEIFNTRLSAWGSEKILVGLIKGYSSEHPKPIVTQKEVESALATTKIELQRNSRNIRISIKSTNPSIAANLANDYARAIETYTDEENKIRCDKAVSQIHENSEKKRREVSELTKRLSDFRTANKVDNLRSSRDTTQQSLSKTTTEILELESKETELMEWEKVLAEVKDDPLKFGSLAGKEGASNIAQAYNSFIEASGEFAKLQMTFTENHPQVQAQQKKVEMAKEQFLSAASRALETGHSMLSVTRNRLSVLRIKREELKGELSSLEQRIVLAESGLGQLKTELGVANRLFEDLIRDENKARIEAESNNEYIRIGREAQEPKTPVAPKPIIIFGAGIAVSLCLGVLFVLVMDNLEDTVVALSDIEGRLALKVLAVFPHVRRKHREQVAKYMLEDKYSRFAEAVASCRNLLDSPRYEAMSHCLIVISTQPGEGKTITSTSLAIANAQAGRKVLHVDFDMRRPRLAKVWGITIDEAHSFSHTLQNASGSVPDFSKLANKTVVEGLDVICSLPPEGVTPSTIIGSSVVGNFFEWARANYDHVIIDSPPFGVVGDVVSLAVLVDSVLIMCCPDRTHFKPIQYCARSLTEAGANILGVIVNDVEVSSEAVFSPTSGRKHGYGKYGYGYGYGYGYYGAYGGKHSSKHKNRGDGDNVAENEDVAARAMSDEVRRHDEINKAAGIDSPAGVEVKPDPRGGEVNSADLVDED